MYRDLLQPNTDPSDTRIYCLSQAKTSVVEHEGTLSAGRKKEEGNPHDFVPRSICGEGGASNM